MINLTKNPTKSLPGHYEILIFQNHKLLMIWKIHLYTCNDPRDWQGEAWLILQYYNTSAWCMMRLAGCLGTYDSEPEDDLACLLLFRARSLSPCVRPFLSSSSLYCKREKKIWIDLLQNAAKSVPESMARVSFKKNSPGPFLPSWTSCSCCSRWWWCHPRQTGSGLRPSCRSHVHLASSPGKHLPLPTDCSAYCRKKNGNKRQIKLTFPAQPPPPPPP